MSQNQTSSSGFGFCTHVRSICGRGMVAESAIPTELRLELGVEEHDVREAELQPGETRTASGGPGVRRGHVRGLPEWQTSRGFSPRCIPEGSPHGSLREQFPPRQEDLGACRIWVGGIPEELVAESGVVAAAEPVTLPRDCKLARQFERFGEVVAVTLRRKPGPCKSWALITFENPEQSGAALRSDIQYGSPPITLKVRREDAKTQLQKPTTGALGAVCRSQQEAEETWFRTMLKSMRPMGSSGEEELLICTPRSPRLPGAADPSGQTGSANVMQIAVKAKPTQQTSQVKREEHTRNKYEQVSIETQTAIAYDQLRLSEKCTDLHAIGAALSTARNLAQQHAQCKALSIAADQLETRLRKSNPKIGKKLELHRNENVKRHVRRLWDLLLLECTAPNEDGSLAVNLDGYCKLHICIGKAVSEDDWNIDDARDYAHNDWNDDVERFAEDSGINDWLAKVKRLLQDRVAESIATFGWQAMFASLDADGDGKLDCDEFISGLRTAGVDTGVCSDQQVKLMFQKADEDGGGEVDGREFADWVSSILELDKQRQKQRMNLDKSTEVALRAVRKLQAQTAERIAELGWKRLFESVDIDGNGELDAEEFCAAMRKHGLSAQEVSDTQLGEVFNLIDADGGGTLTANEFVSSLRKDETAGHTMSPQAFEKSMFELADYWSKGTEEADYIHFFQTLFSAISEPLSGVQGYPFPVISNGKANYSLKDTKYIGSLVNVDGKFDGSLLAGMQENTLDPADAADLPTVSNQGKLDPAGSSDVPTVLNQTGKLKPKPPSHEQKAAARRKGRAGLDVGDASEGSGKQMRKDNAALPWRAGTYVIAGHGSQSLGPAVDGLQTDHFYQPRVPAPPSDNGRSYKPQKRYVSVSAGRAPSAPSAQHVRIPSARPRSARSDINRSSVRQTAADPQPARPRTSWSRTHDVSSWVPASTYLPTATSDLRGRKRPNLRRWPPVREVGLVEGTLIDGKLVHTKKHRWQPGLRPRMSHMGQVLPWMMLAPCSRDHYL
eukprot:COSAG02_NODE_5097_length_4633_cov_3.366343_1_plen_1011_part_00